MVIELKAVCLACGSANWPSSLECVKCGYPLVEGGRAVEEPKYYGPERGGMYADEVSALEEKIGISQSSNWQKQELDFSLPNGDDIFYEFPQIGIITQIKIFFNYEATADDWRIRLETGPGLLLVDRGNAPGYTDTIRRITDAETSCNTRLRLTHRVSAFGRPRKIGITRWVPTSARR